MATRQERIEAFCRGGAPPTGQPLELLCEDRVGTDVIAFPRRRRTAAGGSLETDKGIEATVPGWRVPGQNQR